VGIFTKSPTRCYWFYVQYIKVAPNVKSHSTKTHIIFGAQIIFPNFLEWGEQSFILSFYLCHVELWLEEMWESDQCESSLYVTVNLCGAIELVGPGSPNRLVTPNSRCYRTVGSQMMAACRRIRLICGGYNNCRLWSSIEIKFCKCPLLPRYSDWSSSHLFLT
jgi:hypothetical protein